MILWWRGVSRLSSRLMPARDLLRLCEAVPSLVDFRASEDDAYTGFQSDLASHVVESLAWERPDELRAMFDIMEQLYAQAEMTSDRDLENALTIGLFETLLYLAEDEGLDFRKIASAITGERTKEGWEAALAYVKPEFVWDDVKGLVAREPLPTPVGTVRVHRGYSDRSSGAFVIELQLISGEIRAGYLLRSRIGAGHYYTGNIAEVRQRSADLPDELEVRIALSAEHQFEAWENWMDLPREEFWQIAVPAPTAAR